MGDYDTYFNGFEGFTPPPQREDLRKSLLVDDRNRAVQQDESEAERTERWAARRMWRLCSI